MQGAIRHFGVHLVALIVLLLPASVRAEEASTDCGNRSGYQAGAPWPAYHGCSTRLGLTDVHGPTSPTLNWRLNVGGGVNAPVVAADGTIYVGAGAQLVAVSSTGVQRWSTWAFGNIASAPAIGADGTIYVVSAAGALVAINPANGSVKWVYRGAWGHAINTSPLIDGAGTIYFVDSFNFAHAVNPNGVAKWVMLFPGPVFSSLTMSRDSTTLYAGSAILGLRAINAANGALIWVNLTPMAELSTPTIGDDGTIYAGSVAGFLYAVSPRTGQTKWAASHKVSFVDLWGAIGVPPSLTPSGNIVFGTTLGSVVALSPSGAILWERALGAGPITAGPLVDKDGNIFVGAALNKVFALNSQGQQIWSYQTIGNTYSSPAMGAQGTLYIGANDNYLYSIGIGRPDAFGTPLVVPPTQAILVPGNSSGSSGGGGSNSTDPTVTYCSDSSLPSPALLSSHPAPNQGWVSPRPGLISTYFQNGTTNPNHPSPYFSVTGIDPASTTGCSAHLCGAETGTQLAASDEATLLNGNTLPQNVPSNLYVPCDALPSRTSCSEPDYTKVHYAAACAASADCPADTSYVCALVCPKDPSVSGNVGAPTAQCDLSAEQQFCVPVVQIATCAEQLVSDSNCFTVTECARPDDVLTAADVVAMCTPPGTITPVPCDSLNQGAAVAQPPTKKELTAQYPTDADQLSDVGTDLGAACALHQSENANKSDVGGSPAHSGGKKKWGIDLSAGFNTSYAANPGPLGIALPHAVATANFDVSGTVWGRTIDVLSLNGTATADLQIPDVSSTASAKIFGQTIAKVQAGATLAGNPPAPGGLDVGRTPAEQMMALNGQLGKVGASAKARLGQLLRVYNQVVKAPANSGNTIAAVDRTVTHALCVNVMSPIETQLNLSHNITGANAVALAARYPQFALDPSGELLNKADQSPVVVDPICDAPLTSETAKLVLNKIVSNYTSAVGGIDNEFAQIFEATPSAGSPYAGNGVPGTTPWGDFSQAIADYNGAVGAAQRFAANGNGYDGSATISGLHQTFSIIGAEATFPIGPLALVLEIQGTGTWGINGTIGYGFAYNLAARNALNGIPLKAHATATVVPYAGVDADLFVGIGIDIGIGGASVGVDGNITLVRVSVPVGGSLALQVTNVGSEPANRAWPASMQQLQSLGQLVTPTQYKVSLTGQVSAGAEFAALNGSLSLAVRVHLLFFHKTWRKQIASLPGFQKSFQWVGTFNTGVDFKLPNPNAPSPLTGVQMPSPELAVLPSLPFPNIPLVTTADFTSLNPAVPTVGGTSRTVPDTNDVATLANFMLTNADFFSNGWIAGSNSDPWQVAMAYPPTSGSMQTALNSVTSVTDFGGVPAACKIGRPPTAPPR